MKELTLLEIAECLGKPITVKSGGGGENIKITSVSTDTRVMRRGDLFVALKGGKYDGNDFIPVALKKGASAVICGTAAGYGGDTDTDGIPRIVVEDGLAALQTLAAYYRTKFDIPVIAVTGSAGKTTTKEMIACALSANYNVYRGAGNLNNQVGVPKSILELDEIHTAAVFELGMDRPDEIRFLSDMVKPDIAVITGIGNANVGNLGSVRKVLAAKLEIVSGLKSGGTLIISADDTLLKDVKPSRTAIAALIRSAVDGAAVEGGFPPESGSGYVDSERDDTVKILRVSMDEDSITADFTASHIALSSNEISFTLTKITVPEGDDSDSFFLPQGFGDNSAGIERDEHICVIPVRGRHNVANALHAFAVAAVLGVDLSRAAAELAGFFPVAMRGDVSRVKGVVILKDYYSSTPQSARAALTSLAEYENPRAKRSVRRIAILGELMGLGEYSSAEHRELGRFCEELQLNAVFFAGPSHGDFSAAIGAPQHKLRARVSRPIEDAADKYADETVYVRVPGVYSCASKEEMIDRLRSCVREQGITDGDIVLIKAPRLCAFEEVYENLKRFINAEISDFVPLPPSPTRLYVNVNNVRHNYLKIRQYWGGNVTVLPMVKANAYGCGAEVISNIFGHCKFVAVADVKEAAIIRRSIPEMGIVIIYQPLPSDICEIVDNGYVTAVSDIGFLRQLNDYAGRGGSVVSVHIEVDTGHARLGIDCNPAVCADFAREVALLPHIRVDGIFTHYSSADMTGADSLEFTKSQTERFKAAAAAVEGVIGEVIYKHAASGACLACEYAEAFNMVRPGYSLYGYYSAPHIKNVIDLRPALRHATKILQLRTVPAGTPVSYSRTFVTERETRLATIAAGYSDGISRLMSNEGCVVVNGQRAPICGRVCMDLCMLDVTDIFGEVNVGDEVFLFDNVNVTVEELAEITRTTGYEVLSRIEDKADKVEEF